MSKLTGVMFPHLSAGKWDSVDLDAEARKMYPWLGTGINILLHPPMQTEFVGGVHAKKKVDCTFGGSISYWVI